MIKQNKNLIFWITVVSVMTAITLFLPYQYFSVIKFLRIIFGSIFILFLPGYLLTLSFFDDKEIDILERFALSFALSISVVPLLSFYLNLLGVKISELSVFLIVLSIIILNLIYLLFFKNIKYEIKIKRKSHQ